ncbi:MAG: hypothetical protein OHK0018_12040 [Erythrobacter tepidarius]
MMQPPARGTAIGVVPGAFVIEDIDHHDRASLGGVVERGIVGKTQVAPQPYDLGVTHAARSALPGGEFHTFDIRQRDREPVPRARIVKAGVVENH